MPCPSQTSFWQSPSTCGSSLLEGSGTMAHSPLMHAKAMHGLEMEGHSSLLVHGIAPEDVLPPPEDELLPAAPPAAVIEAPPAPPEAPLEAEAVDVEVPPALPEEEEDVPVGSEATLPPQAAMPKAKRKAKKE